MRLMGQLAERGAPDGLKDAPTPVDEPRDGAEKLAVSYLVVNHEEKELPSNGF